MVGKIVSPLTYHFFPPSSLGRVTILQMVSPKAGLPVYEWADPYSNVHSSRSAPTLFPAKCIKRIPRQDRRTLVIAHAYEIKRVPSSAMFVVLTSLMYLKMSSMARGMIPVSGPLPVMVWVFPLDVCPYANTVPKNREEEEGQLESSTSPMTSSWKLEEKSYR